MQNENDIKKLLQENALLQTSQIFSDAVMKRITPSFIKQEKPLLNPLIITVLKSVFIVCSLLLGVYLPLSNNKNYFMEWMDTNNNFYTQLFSFLIAFWVVMFANIFLSKRKSKIITP